MPNRTLAMRPVTVALLAALALLLAACAGSDSALEGEPAQDAVQPAGGEAGTDTDPGAGTDTDSGSDDATSEREVAGAGFGEADGTAQATPLPEPAQVRSGERVIKEGTMTIEVDEGAFLAAYQRVVVTARELGGHVTASTSASTDDGGTSGSVTVRVPVDRYEDLLTRIGGVGTLRNQDITSQDVTGEFTDLESRLRHLRAQEAFYLGLLEEAEGVQDAIAVKQQLDGIQSEIERAQGRLDVLDDRTSYSTLTVQLVEPGTSPVLTAAGDRPTLSRYWAIARDGFVTVIGWILVASVSLAPLLVALALAAVVWRATRRRGVVPATVATETE